MDKISALQLRNPTALTRGIGQRLREARLAAGLTQEEVAERSGVALSTLKLMEAKGQGSLQRLARVAVALGVDGELRELFARPTTYDSIEAVERLDRQRAPRRRKAS